MTTEANQAKWPYWMKEKAQEPPTLLSISAAKPSCCIFRAPPSLLKVNTNAYRPQIVSIGPYHRGKEHLQMIEQHKWRYFHALLDRSGVAIEDFFRAIESKEEAIRECYSEAFTRCDTRELIEIMVLDGCFLIEFFCRFGKLVPRQDDDPIFKLQWILPFLTRDLIQLENQIPFFVLQDLFNISMASHSNGEGLRDLVMKFFSLALNIPEESPSQERHEERHLLHLLHTSFLFPSPETRQKPPKNKDRKLTASATKLNLAGIEFKLKNTKQFLDITFSHGELQIPGFTLDDLTTSLVLNFVAFEVCYQDCANDFIDYVSFMNSLLKTPEDAGILSENKIIHNLYGTDKEVVRFFSDVNRDIPVDPESSYLYRVLDGVKHYHTRTWNAHCAELRHKYFHSPWSSFSVLAAVVLLLLTAAQTYFAVYGYFKPPK